MSRLDQPELEGIQELEESQPGVVKVDYEESKRVRYSPTYPRPTLSEVRQEMRRQPFEPSRCLAQYLRLDTQTPISKQQVENLPADITAQHHRH